MRKKQHSQEKKKTQLFSRKKLNAKEKRSQLSWQKKEKKNHREKKSQLSQEKIMISTLSWEKPSRSRKKPWKTLKFRENQFSLMRRKPQPAQDNKLDFLERKINSLNDKRQLDRRKKSTLSRKRKTNSTLFKMKKEGRKKNSPKENEKFQLSLKKNSSLLQPKKTRVSQENFILSRKIDSAQKETEHPQRWHTTLFLLSLNKKNLTRKNTRFS